MKLFRYVFVALSFCYGLSAHFVYDQENPRAKISGESKNSDPNRKLSLLEFMRDSAPTRSATPFEDQIKSFDLSKKDRFKVIKVYNKCLQAWHRPDERKHFEPKICSAVKDFPYLRHPHHGVKIRTTPDEKSSGQQKAYDLLIQEANVVMKQEQLSDAEKVMMAKCIAETSVNFFAALHHPLKGLKASSRVSYRSPESELFCEEGVCTNLSAIILNIANRIGLAGRVFAARKTLHVYLEIEINGRWYHIHPLNSIKQRCDFISFNQ